MGVFGNERRHALERGVSDPEALVVVRGASVLQLCLDEFRQEQVEVLGEGIADEAPWGLMRCYEIIAIWGVLSSG